MKLNGVMLRRLRDDEADYLLLDKWCGSEEVYRYFEQRILKPEEIRRKYAPRTLEAADVPVYMIEYQERPAGIIQYQAMGDESRACCALTGGTGYEIDLFIGEEDLRGQGIGKAALSLFAQFLFENKSADVLALCPVRENSRAVRCYHKCGFEEAGRFSAPDTIGVVQEYVCMARVKRGG